MVLFCFRNESKFYSDSELRLLRIAVCSEPRGFLPSVNFIVLKYFKCELFQDPVPSAKIRLLSIAASTTLPGQFFQVNIFPWRIFSNKFIFSNKNLCYILWFLLEQCFQWASFHMVVIVSVSLASKCLLVHFKFFCDPEVYWIVKKATEMTFAVFCDFIICRKTFSVTWKSEG